MIEIDVPKLIPQSPPFVMIEKLIECDNLTTKTSFRIETDNIFVENGYLSGSGILENVAQTCAARMGYLTLNNPVRIGMIGGINDFDFFELPLVGTKIFTEIIVEMEVGNIVLLETKVFDSEKVYASGKMKVILTDIEI